jgi:macrolide transport system ATP-binding/permease protein
VTTTHPDTSRPLLQIDGLARTFGSDPAVHALVDVNLRLESGQWLAITGPSGAGKSTLLHILGCLDRPTSGTYFFDGVDTATLSDRQRAGLRSRGIGFVFQAFHLLPYRSVLENVMLAEVYRGQCDRGRRERALAALEKVGLRDRADFLPINLSGGQKQRVAIARALLGSPRLLLCDEPTGNLDSRAAGEIVDLLEDLNRQGLTLVIVTHNEEIAKRAGRRVHIVDGVLTEITTPEDHTPRLPPHPSPAACATTPPSASTLHLTTSPILRSGITIRDLLQEAIAGMFARPGRMLLTVLGIVVGLTALVATLGLTRTANNRIIGQFDKLAATEIIVTARRGPSVDPKGIPWDAPARLHRLNGVVAAGTLSDVAIGNRLVSSSPVKDPRNQTAFKLSVKAASPDLFPTVRAELGTGRFPDLGHSNRADRVAVLGPTAARRLGIVGLQQLPAISIGDHVYLVIGIMQNVARQPELLSSVIIPEGTARRYFGLEGPGSVIVETRIGAASLIAQQTPLALRPDNPSVLRLEVPPEPKRVRDEVQGDLNIMFLLLGGLSLVVGALGIANITLVSVMERTGEIGLRRAIGATRSHIAMQFLLESGSMGVAGGIIGASFGVLIVVAVSAYEVWTPVLDPGAPLLAPILGGVIGLVSGAYPALRAAHVEPVVAFRN